MAPLDVVQFAKKFQTLFYVQNGTFWFILDYILEQKGHMMHPSAYIINQIIVKGILNGSNMPALD